MPYSLRHCKLLVWMTLAWLGIQSGKAEIPKYGMRLRPLPTALHQNCATCFNQTSNNKTVVSKTKNLNLQTSTQQESPVRNSKARTHNYYHTTNNQHSPPSYIESLNDNSKKGATFFFTQVEPHRFEYRAMFQHQQSDVFQPFVHDFEAFSKEFPPLPKFPTFPEFTAFFPEHKDPFPEHKDHFQNHQKNPLLELKDPFPEHKTILKELKDPFPEHKNIFKEQKDPFPNINQYSFPTLPPSIKRAWTPLDDINLQRSPLDDKFEGPLLKNYDIVLGHTGYPKIFRFNEERINIEEFDREKKLRFYSLNPKEQNALSEPENVKRDHLLILHGGIFTVQEPPLYKHKHVKKRRKMGYGSYRPRL